MQAPPPARRSAAGPLFAIGAAAVIAVAVVHVAGGPKAASDRATRPATARAQQRVVHGPETPAGLETERTQRQIARARAFARDWLDYLGGRRDVSTVRGASPELKLTFAGGAPPALSISRADLRSVACAPETARGRVCTATAVGLGRFRFAMTPADGGGLQVSQVELD